MHENQSNSNSDSLTVVNDNVRNSVYFNDIVEVLECFDHENQTQIKIIDDMNNIWRLLLVQSTS